MRKQYLLIICAATLALATLACQLSLPDVNIGYKGVRGSRSVDEESRQVSDITSVRLANQGDLFITLGDEEKLVIEAEDNLLEYIESEVRNGELVLETRQGVNLRPRDPIRYYLTVKELDKITVSISSSGDYDGRNLKSLRAEVRLSSSGSATIRVSDELDANLSSSGDLKYIGDPTVDARQSSSGDVIQLSD